MANKADSFSESYLKNRHMIHGYFLCAYKTRRPLRRLPYTENKCISKETRLVWRTLCSSKKRRPAYRLPECFFFLFGLTVFRFLY
jgi:hypothetical protein